MISVIVPALDEVGRIRGCLRSARRAFGDEAELLVVDGGSRDGTRSAAAPLARVVECRPCRGLQLDTGARASRGDVLVFLHADTRLPPGSGAEIRSAVSRPGVVGGCFRFGVHPPPTGLDRYRLLEVGVRARTRILGWATGDQTLFVTRTAYRACGGVPHIPLFEDVEFARRLRREGDFRVVRAVSRTSRRRWEERGFLRTVVTHWALRAAHAAGVDAERLWVVYGRGGRPRSGAYGAT